MKNLLTFCITTFCLVCGTVFFNFYCILHQPIPFTVPSVAQSAYVLSKNKDMDFVFVGNSRTKFHINSTIINSITHDKVLNIGIPSDYFQFWANVFDLAIKSRPKNIVLSINAEDLYQNIYYGQGSNISTYGNFSALKVFVRTRDCNYENFSAFFNASINNLIDLTPSYYWFYSIIYGSKFGIKDDCVRNNMGTQDVFYCSNNDGYILTTVPAPIESTTFINYSVQQVNHSSYEYLSSLIETAKTNKINVYLVLLPSYRVKSIINTINLEKLFGVKIINMSNFLVESTDTNYWAYNGYHLNRAGSILFSTNLSYELNKILKSNKSGGNK